MFRPDMNQEPIDIAKDYEKYEYEHLPKSETPDKPEEMSLSMVRRGVLDPETGKTTGNSKQHHAQYAMLKGYSKKAADNFDRIFNQGKYILAKTQVQENYCNA